ncbi:MAG: hypothetical protein HFJ54_05920 [Clostridia bacterium]|nr:hypothetical protein [Clostridia bacterium]
MQKLKILWTFLIFIIIFGSTHFVYADDEIEETDVTPEEIEQILEATTEAIDIPVINSRNATIYDRKSRESIIWKK